MAAVRRVRVRASFSKACVVGLAAVLSGCLTDSSNDKIGDVGQVVSESLKPLDITAVYPFRQDIQMGDVFLHVSSSCDLDFGMISTRRIARIPAEKFQAALVKDYNSRMMLAQGVSKPKDASAVDKNAVAVNATTTTTTTANSVITQTTVSAPPAATTPPDVKKPADTKPPPQTAPAIFNNDVMKLALQTLPIAAFPGYTVANVVGGTFGATVPGFSANAGSQSNRQVAISLDGVIEVGLPEVDFYSIVDAYATGEGKGILSTSTLKKIAERMSIDANGRCPPDKNAGKSGSHGSNPAALKASETPLNPNYDVWVINRIFYAATITFSFADDTQVALEVGKKLGGGLPVTSAGAAKPNVPVESAPIAGAATGSQGASVNAVYSALAGLIGADTPGVATSFGYGASGALQLSKTYPIPLAFGIGSYYRIEIPDMPVKKGEPAKPPTSFFIQ